MASSGKLYFCSIPIGRILTVRMSRFEKIKVQIVYRMRVMVRVGLGHRNDTAVEG